MNKVNQISEKILKEMLLNLSFDNGYDINNGFCNIFAEKIITSVQSDNLVIITTDDLINFIDGNKAPPVNMADSVDMFFSQIESKLFKDESFIDVNTVLYEMGYHEWIFDLDSGLHYDAESTSGLSDISEIPFVRDHIFMALAKSGYFFDKREQLVECMRGLARRVMDNTNENSGSFNVKNRMLNITLSDMEKIYSGITLELKEKGKLRSNHNEPSM